LVYLKTEKDKKILLLKKISDLKIEKKKTSVLKTEKEIKKQISV
jgi:hypothetical protein